jgi:hypothetical protein
MYNKSCDEECTILKIRQKGQVESLRLNIDTRILQAAMGNCSVVFDGSKYKDKYKPLPKDSRTKVEGEV